MKISLPRILFGLGILLLVVAVYMFASSSPVAKIEPRVELRDRPVRIVAFGDSLTVGVGARAEASYPVVLEQSLRQLGYNVVVKNEGVSGETTKENLLRVATIVEQKPDIVLLGIGGNDALRRLPVVDMRNNIEETILTLQKGTTPPVVVLLGMQAPPTSGLQYKKDFDDVYQELAEKYKILLLPFFTTELYLNPSYRSSDGIHFSEAGYQKVVEDYLLDEMANIIDEMTP